MTTLNDFNPALRDDVKLGPCIGLFELRSVARGIEVADAVLWEASVEVLFSEPVHPGKYVVLFTGGVQDVGSALRRGAETAGDDLLEDLLIQQIHPQVELGLRRRGGRINGSLDAIGVVETNSVASSIRSADLALKTATVDLLDLRIANGLGGKSFFTLTGVVSDVRAAVTAGARLAQECGQLARDVVIARPHPDLARHLQSEMAKRLVTEADVRAMAPGSCLSLGGGTIATPAALDLAHQRGVRVRWDGEPEHAASSALWKKLTARDGAYVVVVSNGRATAHRLEDGGPVLVGNEGGAS